MKSAWHNISVKLGLNSCKVVLKLEGLGVVVTQLACNICSTDLPTIFLC